MAMLPGETVSIALITGVVMALLALASGALYALHVRDERRFSGAMAASAELRRVDFRGAWRGTALFGHPIVVSFSLMRADDPQTSARAPHDAPPKARVKQPT